MNTEVFSSGLEERGRRPHRRLVAVLFADMVGYSRQMERDEEQTSLQTVRSVELFKSLVEDSGIVQGHCVNVAARLQQMGEPGGILISGAVRDAARERSGMVLHSLGHPPLKNIEDPMEVLAVSWSVFEPPQNAGAGATHAAEAWRQPSIAVL